jgi:endonuclease YncB( thermonuclease family)
MRRLVILSLLIVTTACIGAPPQTVSGRVDITDGDSFEIGGTRIRLHAVDAPEGRQTCVRNGSLWRCGEEAAAKLRSLVAGRTVTCTRKDTDNYGRMVAVCSNGAADLGEQMVTAGLALAYRQYGNDYVDAENAAHAARRGLWAGEFTAPSEYRQSQRADSGAAAPRQDSRPTRQSRPAAPGPAPSTPAGCRIKGNISDNGKIYHLPGSEHYDDTRIDESKGERWFCSEQEARAAGWRAPRG